MRMLQGWDADAPRMGCGCSNDGMRMLLGWEVSGGIIDVCHGGHKG
jgi:hypothetical protein